MVDTLSLCYCWNGNDNRCSVKFNHFGNFDSDLWPWNCFSRKSISNRCRMWYRNHIYRTISRFCQSRNRKLGETFQIWIPKPKMDGPRKLDGHDPKQSLELQKAVHRRINFWICGPGLRGTTIFAHKTKCPRPKNIKVCFLALFEFENSRPVLGFPRDELGWGLA